MDLTFFQIKDITIGAAQVVQEEAGVQFHRFTAEQEALYATLRENQIRKTKHTSGVALCFRTNSESLRLTGVPSDSMGRRYFAVEVQVDGKTIGAVDNYSHLELPEIYSTFKPPVEPFDCTFDLGAGEKEVRVYLPWSMRVTFSRIAVDDGAMVIPAKPKHKMICFGDSITHGYDALLPTHKYVTQLARYLDAEEYNKAIGGDWFFPELAAAKDDFEPDYISVAYGTNDWGKKTLDELNENGKAFFANLHANYPKAKVFVITPIWRKDTDRPNNCCVFEDVHQVIADMVQGYDNMVVVPGYDLVPHDESYFADRNVHPNDKGFACYFAGIRKYIEQL